MPVRSEVFPLMLEFEWALVDSWDSSVSVVTRLLAAQQKNRGSIPDMGLFSSPELPDQFWNLYSLVFNRYRWLHPLRQNGRGM